MKPTCIRSFGPGRPLFPSTPEDSISGAELATAVRRKPRRFIHSPYLLQGQLYRCEVPNNLTSRKALAKARQAKKLARSMVCFFFNQRMVSRAAAID